MSRILVNGQTMQRWASAAVVVLGAGPVMVSGQSREDSLAVVAAALRHFTDEGEEILLSSDSPELVLSAADRIGAGTARRLGDQSLVFCGGVLAPEYMQPGELIGRRVRVSLTPGSGPLPAKDTTRDSTAASSSPLDFTRSRPGIWAPAFYIDHQVAYVAVSASCMRRPGGGGVTRSLEDGRVVGSFIYGSTYELRREGQRWVVVRTLNTWIT